MGVAEDTPGARSPARGEPTSENPARRQIRGSSLLLVGRLISVVANMVVQVLLVRELSRTEYGAFAYALSLVSLAQIAVTLGVDRALPRFLALYDETGDQRRLAGTVLLSLGSVLAMGLAVVLVVSAVGGSLVGDQPGGEEAAAILAVLVFLAPIRGLEEIQLGILATFAPPRAIFLRRHVLAPVLNLVVVALLVARDADAVFLAAGYVVAAILGLAVSASLAWSALERHGFGSRLAAREVTVPWAPVFGFALPLLTTDALYLLINASDSLFLAAFHGTEAVAALRAVVPVAMLNMLVMTSFTPLYAPIAARLLARDERRELADLYWQTAIWIAVTTFPLFVLTVAFATPLVTLLFGPAYASSAPYLVILSAGYYVNAALGFNGLTLRILGRLRSIVIVNGACCVLNIGLNLALVPTLGPLGAAIATAATLLAHNLGKQVLLAGTGIEPVRRSLVPLYGSIGALSLAAAAVGSMGLDALPVQAAVAGVAVLFVGLLARAHLRVADMFPEVLRLPFGRWLFSPR